MTKIWIVNDEYVSLAGHSGLHLGLISKGFDISTFEVENLTSNQIHEKAEEYFNICKKYPDTCNLKMVIDSLPQEIEKIIDEISASLLNNTYDTKKDKQIIDWLLESFEEYQFYENTYEVADVISRECFQQHYLFESSLQDYYDISTRDDITDIMRIEFIKEKLREVHETSECVCVISSITFRTQKNNIVLYFDLYSFNNPGALPILNWGKFYLSDLDIWNDVQKDSDLIQNYWNLNNEEILDLIWTKDIVE